MNYDYTDKVIAYIDNRLIEGFSRLKSLVSFDELNVMQDVNALCNSMYVIIRGVFLMLANKVYQDNVRRKGLRELDEQWLDEILNGYDPVSKYVFSSEIDRKRARLIEAIMASSTKSREVDAAMRSLSLMCRIYADRVTDEAVMRAYVDDEEGRVKWVAEKDGKTCPVCLSRDGRIYEIEDLPSKPHINCRCRLERVRKHGRRV